MSNLCEKSGQCQVMTYIEGDIVWKERRSLVVESMSHQSIGRVEVCYSPGSFQGLVANILKACQFEPLTTLDPIKAVVSLGVYADQFEPGLHTLVQSDQSQVLWLQSYPLDQLSLDKDLKKNLWLLLKKIFY
ncbi:MAG TPA: hypothetical protein QF353_00415 [Gammaproteobacteria bacterium]|nr:hypothetical protein [Gammaproteobacteria bacterium]